MTSPVPEDNPQPERSSDNPDPQDSATDEGAKSHQDAVDQAMDLLSSIHPPGSFNVQAVTQGNVTVVHATDNPEYVDSKTRAAVAQEFRTIGELLKVAEAKPADGAIQEVTIAGQTHQISFDSMEAWLGLVKLGLDTVRTHYQLIESEATALRELTDRYDALNE